MEIKILEVSDANKLDKLMQQIDFESKFLLYKPGERDINYEYLLDNDEVIFIGLFDKNNLVGFLSLISGRLVKNSHKAGIAMGILRSYQNVGFGYKLLLKAEEISKEIGITRLELSVMSINKKAWGLYEKFGFVEEGVMKNSLKVEGEYVDEVFLGKLYD